MLSLASRPEGDDVERTEHGKAALRCTPDSLCMRSLPRYPQVARVQAHPQHGRAFERMIASSDVWAYALRDAAHSRSCVDLPCWSWGSGKICSTTRHWGHELATRLGDTPRLPRTPRCPIYQPDRPVMISQTLLSRFDLRARASSPRLQQVDELEYS
jgi:hypothetical protein